MEQVAEALKAIRIDGKFDYETIAKIADRCDDIRPVEFSRDSTLKYGRRNLNNIKLVEWIADAIISIYG